MPSKSVYTTFLESGRGTYFRPRADVAGHSVNKMQTRQTMEVCRRLHRWTLDISSESELMNGTSRILVSLQYKFSQYFKYSVRRECVTDCVDVQDLFSICAVAAVMEAIPATVITSPGGRNELRICLLIMFTLFLFYL